ncbi:hypothetical protein C8R45DRAFT_1045102 [Mycena sanguinolenta]|nr:hypothetical protein C8R45DRAFT_1045102 [Mycena sanguinolenta]
MLGEATTSLSISQYISGGTGGHGGDSYDQGHGGNGGRGEGPTINYNITAGQFNMNNQDIEPCERKRIIEWVSPLNFFVRQDDIFSTRQEGTGEWLLNEKQFKRWESSIGGVLWCRGIPGVGKTVLVYDHLIWASPLIMPKQVHGRELFDYQIQANRQHWRNVHLFEPQGN